MHLAVVGFFPEFCRVEFHIQKYSKRATRCEVRGKLTNKEKRAKGLKVFRVSRLALPASGLKT